MRNQTSDSPDAFLHEQTHAFLPYAFPAETNWDELNRVLHRGFDVIGVTFCGPYSSGTVDFSMLDEVVRRVDAGGARALIHLMPRFRESEGLGDTLSDGRVLHHAWNRNPNYSVIDVFSATQTASFDSYLALAAERYGEDDRVAGFCIYWGYQGETGFYTGDFLSDYGQMGAVSAGYSENALREYNHWREQHGRAAVMQLPLPSAKQQSSDYVDFMHFRYDWLSRRFETDAVRTMKSRTPKPVGIFAYLPAGKESYARNWCPVSEADFYRSAGSAASYNNYRTLSDSGIGWEDSLLHAGVWDKTFAAMRRDEIRMMAHGAVFHAMWCRHYESEPGWETGIYDKVADFIRDEAPDIRRRMTRRPANIGLFLPTWSCAAWPGRTEDQQFLLPEDINQFIRLHVGIVESFGLDYDLLTEADLADPRSLESYDLVLVIAGNHLPEVLGADVGRELPTRQVCYVNYEGSPPTRSRIREILRKRNVPFYLDYDAEVPLAGYVQNVLFNFSNVPIQVRIAGPDGLRKETLAAHEVRFLKDHIPLP